MVIRQKVCDGFAGKSTLLPILALLFKVNEEKIDDFREVRTILKTATSTELKLFI